MTAIAPHRCRGCGVVGRLSLADPDRADRRPVLKIVFGGPNDRPQLLCSLCEPAEGRDVRPTTRSVKELNRKRLGRNPEASETQHPTPTPYSPTKGQRALTRK
jgi:hypothetical protein